jgi:PIN domain nuclease of toxin-antitoxin system
LNLLLDTQLLLWTAGQTERMPRRAAELIKDPSSDLSFSVASLWEIAIKRGLNRPDFVLEPRVLRRNLLDAGYNELPVTAPHALEVQMLPQIHGDPFDRLLLAQAMVEGLTLITTDARLALYAGPVLRV